MVERQGSLYINTRTSNASNKHVKKSNIQNMGHPTQMAHYESGEWQVFCAFPTSAK